MPFAFSRKSQMRMVGVHPDLILIFYEALKVSPIDFGIPRDGGLRTAERQNELYNQVPAVTRLDGYARKSRHQIDPEISEYGLALDVYAYVNGKASWDKTHLAIIAGVILSTANRLKAQGRVSIGIRWGGTFGSDNFRGWDYPHFEAVL